MTSTRAYYSGSRFFPNFAHSTPTHVSLIFYGESVLRQDTILKITETTLSEIADPKAQSHFTLKVGVKPRPGTPNGHVVRIVVSFYDRTKDNKMKPTNARISYNWLTASEDWSNATPKLLAATYVRPKTQTSSSDGRRVRRVHCPSVFRRPLTGFASKSVRAINAVLRRQLVYSPNVAHGF